MTSPTPAPETAATNRKTRWRRMGRGMILGGVAGAAIEVLNVNVLFRSFGHTILAATIVGGMLGLTRWRKLLWYVNAVLVIGILVISYTPLAKILIHTLDCSDPPAPADAIVVLADGYIDNQTIAAEGQDRVLCALRLLRGGYSHQLVLTRPVGTSGGWTNLVRREMLELGLDFPVDQTEPVRDTHDESLEIARIARARGWHRVILVTQTWHMRRAGALFQKTGLTIIRVPCGDSTYDSQGASNPYDRLCAFRDWLHESVGYVVYEMRGWI
jgi:uncharacterized SAM-binding protein YcdF (DUF218 family)